MSRVIKFRAWVTSKAANRSWMNNEIEFIGGKINDNFNNNDNRFTEITYMQYTGLKDSTGRYEDEDAAVDIYESDILWDSFANNYYLVVWDEDYGAWLLEFIKGDKPSAKFYDFAEWDNEVGSDFYVVGNKYENPKLMEESK